MAKSERSASKAENSNTEPVGAEPVQQCGLVMPISPIADYPADHWVDVKAILVEAIAAAGFKAELVSFADDVGIIQKRIVQNLYENPIVVCDVSGKNPNVMFELGLRLAFDKPTIIVKDDATEYSFDTSPIEHLGYPRDLRFAKIVTFKELLAAKIKGTMQAAEDPHYSPFLKHFGKFTVARLETKEVSKEDYILAELKELKGLVLTRSRSDLPSAASGVSELSKLYMSHAHTRDLIYSALMEAARKRMTKGSVIPTMQEVEDEVRNAVMSSAPNLSADAFCDHLESASKALGMDTTYK